MFNPSIFMCSIIYPTQKYRLCVFHLFNTSELLIPMGILHPQVYSFDNPYIRKMKFLHLKLKANSNLQL